MKKIFLLSCLFFAFRSQGQQPYNFKKYKENIDSSMIFRFNKMKGPNQITKDSLDRLLNAVQRRQYSPGLGTLSFVHSNGNKFYTLPQDNMLCIVPDMSQFNMPVAGKAMKIEEMPPGSVTPQLLIPKTK